MAILAVMMSLSVFGQNKVTGKVTDANGEPLPGVAVFVKGTTNAVSTSLDGSYSISAKESDVLTFSSIGYEGAEAAVGKRAIINVTLEESLESLEGTVVTGYQTLSKERATGSFDIVKKAQIEKPTDNIASRLVGAAAGVAYTSDEYGNPTFTIRGTSSFSASTTPLIVIDGFQTQSTLADLNPNDVESITILKDAAAASIWGAKSANGVIVITTKNARSNGGKAKVTVDYSGFYKISPKLDLDYALSEASVDEVIDYEVNMFDKADSSLWYPEESDYSGGTSLVYNYLNEVRLGHMSQSDANSKINALRSNNNYDQVRKYLLQNPSTLQQNVSVNIATDRSQSNFSVLYQDSDFVYKNRDSQKYMVNFRNRTNLFKWLDATIGGTYNYTKTNNSGYGLSGLSPYEMLVDDNGDYIRYSGGISLNYLERHLNGAQFPYSDWTFNPVEEGENRELYTYSNLARIQGGLTFKIIKGLTIDAKAQYEIISGRTHNYQNENTYYVRSTVNTAATWNQQTGAVTANLPSGGILDQSSNQTTSMTMRLQANFNRTFAEKHAIAAVAGVETVSTDVQTFSYPTTYGYNDNTLSVGTYANGIGTSNAPLKSWQGYSESFSPYNSFSYSMDRYFSAFANASYTYNGKYTVSASARTDASNLITDDPKYRYAPFWSVGASWQLGKEDFMKGLGWLDMLNIRATYGYNGNVDKTTTFKPLLNPSASANLATGEYTATMASRGNPTLRWEKTRTVDLGFDFSMLDSKLHGKFDVYNKHSLDLIASRTLPYVQGASSVSLNNGEISNKGFEIELGSTLPINKDIVWDGTLMLSYNKNRVKSLKQTPSAMYYLTMYSGTSYAWMEDYDMNTLWCYKYGGIVNKGTEANPDWQPTIVSADGETHQTFATWPSGELLDYANNMGTLVAPVNASFSTSLKIYDFEVSMILTGKFGHKFMRESFNYPAISGRSIPNAKYSEIVNCDPDEMVPLPMKDYESRYYFWDRFYPYLSYLATNASLIRIQEIDLGYNLPKAATSWLGVNTMKVFFQATNPCNIFFNKWHEDPEFVRGTTPLQAYYMLGVKCNF